MYVVKKINLKTSKVKKNNNKNNNNNNNNSVTDLKFK